MKELANRALGGDHELNLEAEREMFGELFSSDDAKEGMGAKSKPQETLSLSELGVDGLESRTEVYALNDPPARGDSQKIADDGNAAQAVLDFLAEKRLV